MIWDKLFWLWFAVAAVLFLLILSDEATVMSMFFGYVLAGLGLAKIAGERSSLHPVSHPAVSRKPLDKLRKGS